MSLILLGIHVNHILMERVEEFGSFDAPVWANLSAVSLPVISQWEGNDRKEIEKLFSSREWIIDRISKMVSDLYLFMSRWIESRAAFESVQKRILLLLIWWVFMNFRASRMPESSAVNIEKHLPR